MSFDLSKVLQSSAEVAKKQEEGGNQDGNKRMKLLYPQNGEVKFKLLFNPASQSVLRQIRRHKIEGTNSICLQNYGIECPMCKKVTEINAAKGTDLWQLKANTRGIAFAQFISSNYPPSQDEQNQYKEGEILKLMFPWTVYKDLQVIINSAGANAKSIIAENKGKIIKITRYLENSQTKYRVEVDAFGEYQSFPTDEEYMKALTDLPSLNEQIVPAQANDNINATAHEVANKLHQKYLFDMQNPQGHGQFTQFGQNPNPPFPGQQGMNQGQGMNHSGAQPPAWTNPNQGQQGGFNQPQGQQGFNQQPQFNQPQGQGQQGFNQGNQGFQPNQPVNNPTFQPNQQPNNQGAQGNPQGMNPWDNQQQQGSQENVAWDPTGGQGQGTQSNQQPAQTSQPATPPPGNTGATESGMPACFGQHGTVDQNQCLICPHEVECMAKNQ
ncbi:hypothetical protein HSE3_gp120 [Bacillus phage vB_BceM-HSE3]|nr:hypothetical protein HSE3_gp120 [Bacillus phage vB_BceM-HSE3]